MEQTGTPKTSVLNSPTLRNNQEDGSIQSNRGEIVRYCLEEFTAVLLLLLLLVEEN